MIVVTDLPGVERDDVSLQILNPGTLEISGERKGETEEKSKRILCAGKGIWIDAKAC
jgi:HSP20 family molecular chaperone IbpA